MLGGVSRLVEVLEVDMDLLQFGKEGILWPKFLPPVDGAMLCYDAGDKNALVYLRKLLGKFVSVTKF